MFDNIKVFKTKVVRPNKPHQCIKCGNKIGKKQESLNVTYSYDKRLISIYYCWICRLVPLPTPPNKGGDDE